MVSAVVTNVDSILVRTANERCKCSLITLSSPSSIVHSGKADIPYLAEHHNKTATCSQCYRILFPVNTDLSYTSVLTLENVSFYATMQAYGTEKKHLMT